MFGFLEPAGPDRGHPDRRGPEVRLQRISRHQGVLRQRAVAGVPSPGRGFARGHVPVLRGSVLNISPSYLRPGFAFGGSCLPKDLRSLLHLARQHGADLPLLAGTLTTNELVISEIVDRVVACGERSVALLGLSFKMDTDDLRESPNVELAERLVGKGFDVRIYDPVVNPARLVGANLRHIESKLPHLSRLLAHEPGEALRNAGVAIASSSDPAVSTLCWPSRPVT